MLKTNISLFLLYLTLTPNSAARISQHKINSIIRQNCYKNSTEKSLAIFNQNFFTQNCSCRTTYKSPSDKCMPDISFGIADIKLDNNSLKILELGEGTRSMFEGYERIYGEGSMWKKIWHFLFTQMNALAPKNLPIIFFVDDQILNQKTRTTVSLLTLMKRGDVAVQTIEELAHNQRFVQIQKHHHESETSSSRQSPTGIVVIRHNSAEEKPIKEFFGRNQNLLVCNTAIAPFVNNKKNTDALFFGPLRIHRPYTKVVSKKDSIKKSKTILVESDADIFVIKPTTGCKGQGIIFTPRNKLTKTLTSLFGPQQRGPKTLTHAQRYWDTDTETDIIIESCEQSKPITLGDHQYDPTLRVVYGLSHANDSVSACILGCYWKLPTQPIDAQCSLQEKKLSRISKKKRMCAAPLSPEDEATIYQTFLPVITTIYDQMLANTGCLP